MIQLKNSTGNIVKYAIVVKGNGYGHGIKEVAQLCQESSYVDWICTISLSEALLLRSHGITKPILSLSFIDDLPQKAIEHDITLAVYDFSTITMLNEFGKVLNKKVNIHIKIDTGMSRFGFYPIEAIEIIIKANKLPFINIDGLYTHFAESDNINETFTEKHGTPWSMRIWPNTFTTYKV